MSTLLVDKAIKRTISDALNLDLKSITLGVDAGDLTTIKDAVGPLSLIVANLTLLVIHLLKKVLDKLQAHDTVVGGTGFGQKSLTSLNRSGPEVVDVVRVEDGVDAVLNVVEDLGGALASANDSNAVRSILLAEDLRGVVGELRRVQNTRVLDGEALGLAIAGLDREGLDSTSFPALGGDGENLVVVAHNVVEPRRTPAEVVFILGTGGQESAQVGEVNQAALAVEVVKEGKLRSGVTKSGHVLDEGDLHLGSRKKHTGVPGELGLLLEEENLGGSAIRAELLAFGDGIVNGNGHGQRSRAETSTDQVKLRVRRSALKVGGSLLVNTGPVAGSRSRVVAVGVAVVAVAYTIGSVGISVGAVAVTVRGRGLRAGERNLAVGGHNDGIFI
ncbi:hypothetical protein HG530_010307 [Fusarium avenaceum]|nr:hypothetical protein HG530_010307 [Fusarium avenaceum]